MSDLCWLPEAQMRRIKPYFPPSHGVPRVNDRRIISGIIFIIGNGLRWHDALANYGPGKAIYKRPSTLLRRAFICWRRMGVLNRISAALAAKGRKSDQMMIDATHLKDRPTAIAS